jgi:hypothetical protein
MGHSGDWELHCDCPVFLVVLLCCTELECLLLGFCLLVSTPLVAVGLSAADERSDPNVLYAATAGLDPKCKLAHPVKLCDGMLVSRAGTLC